MPLAPGTKLGPYEIQSALGAGGMGEVYRARDTRFDRNVASNFLPIQIRRLPALDAGFDLQTAGSLTYLRSQPNMSTPWRALTY